MLRPILTSLAGLIAVLALATGVHAQYTGNVGNTRNPAAFNPYQGPALSPYLNMLRGGNPAANYFLGVAPERERRFNDASYQSQLNTLERQMPQQVNDLEGDLPRLPSTGHGASFMSYAPYYSGLNSSSRFQPTPNPRLGPNQKIR